MSLGAVPEQSGPGTAYETPRPSGHTGQVPEALWPQRQSHGGVPQAWPPHHAGQPEAPFPADPAWSVPQQPAAGGHDLPAGAHGPWPAGPESGLIVGPGGAPRDPWRQDVRDTGTPWRTGHSEDWAGAADRTAYTGPHADLPGAAGPAVAYAHPPADGRGPACRAPHTDLDAPAGEVPHAGPPTDPAGAAGDAGADVDPHEVTVQLDAVQLGEGLIRRAASAGGGHEASDGPVFVDASGRRSRLYRRIGMAVAVACAVYAVVIVATLLSGSSDAPWLPVPGQQGDRPAGRVGTSPAPDASVSPSGTGSPGPDDSVAPGPSTSPLPGTGTAVSGVPAGPDAPGASTAARPTGKGTAAGPGTGSGTARPAPTKATAPPGAGDPGPGPEPEPAGPTGTPTETAGDGAPAPAPDALAARPAGPAPVAAGSREERGARSSQSPEYVL